MILILCLSLILFVRLMRGVADPARQCLYGLRGYGWVHEIARRRFTDYNHPLFGCCLLKCFGQMANESSFVVRQHSARTSNDFHQFLQFRSTANDTRTTSNYVNFQLLSNLHHRLRSVLFCYFVIEMKQSSARFCFNFHVVATASSHHRSVYSSISLFRESMRPKTDSDTRRNRAVLMRSTSRCNCWWWSVYDVLVLPHNCYDIIHYRFTMP